MFSNRSIHDRKVSSVLMPLYTRVMKETVRLTDYLQTVDGASQSSGENTESGQFANLYLRKIIAELESPRSFFRIGGARKRDVQPNRKTSAHITRYVAENLHELYSRIDVKDLHVYHAGSNHSRLHNSLSYYRMALLIAANTLEGGTDEKRHSFGGSKTVKSRLGSLRAKSDRLVAIPSAVVDQYKEKEYLLANMDVRAALAEGHFISGLEHFVLQGVTEAKQGGRQTPGVDLDLIADVNRTHSPEDLKKYMTALKDSGMFDERWYQKQYGKRKNPLLAYCQKGYREGKAPNAFFDQAWYCEQYKDIKPEEIIPAYHYVLNGEREGRMPCERFDPNWYRNQYKLDESKELLLVHYIRIGQQKKFNPNAEFDAEYYLAKNADVVSSGMYADDHYYRFGWAESRDPSAKFNVSGYVKRSMNGALTMNPITHSLTQRQIEQEQQASQSDTASADVPVVVDENTPESVTDSDLPSLGDIAGNIRYFANQGPDFEGPSNVDCSRLQAKAKTVAFYLPQFHAFEENDNWWGTGFTEWRNVTRGTPRYAGHYQPRIPRDLGFYDLNNESILHKQAELAKENGIEAFCFYYYWFNGKRLMDKPLDMFAEADIPQDFCIMFANENWTRTWDGFESEVLIKQDYEKEDEDAFIADTGRYMNNPRYMRVDGRPLFILYRPGLLPNSKETLARWRDKWADMLGVAPWILMVQGFGDEDPREFGLDGAVEFPPHKVCKDIPNMHDTLNILDPNYDGYAKSYTDVIQRSLSEEPPAFPLIKTVVPHWDNDARREGRGFTMHGSTPELYEKWLSGAIRYAEQNPFEEEPIVFVNAWNEWAEGAYLEPDVHYGHAYLNATRRAVHGITSGRERQKLLLVGHDAHRHGAQMLLMSMAKIYTNQFGMDVTILLKDSGPLVNDYEKVCNTVVLDQLGKANLEGWVRHEGFDIAICNTSVTGSVIPALTAAGTKVLSLIHELPNLIKEYGLESNLQTIAEQAAYTIFPSNNVQNGFNEFVSNAETSQVISPQGLYMPIEYSAESRNEIRAELGIPSDAKVVLNVGYADLRKGFDIFLQMARQIVSERPDVHFVWAGAIDISMERWVQSDLDAAMAKRVHLVGFTDKMADFYSASDCLFLSSREDPYPSVVLEAMCVGAPVVLFREATGFDSLISTYGQVVDRNDVAQINRALVHCLYNDSRAEKVARAEYVNNECCFDDYCFDLLQMLKPDIKKVSVVVPNYNYEEYMSSRLNSVFNQTYPIFETIVLDDCSKDDSVTEIEDVVESAGRHIELIENDVNSGNVFYQWKKGAKLSRGDYVWIAEADDLADPQFISRSLESFADDTALSFTNSEQIDTDNDVLASDYNYYYRLVHEDLFQNDFRMNGGEFVKRAMSTRNVILNVSSVLWNREVLSDAIDSIGDELFDLRLVGDWRLYLEALSDKRHAVSYIADSLNVHRRHKESVTHSLDADLHLEEIQHIHSVAIKMIGFDDAMEQEMDEYIKELQAQFDKATIKNKAAA